MGAPDVARVPVGSRSTEHVPCPVHRSQFKSSIGSIHHVVDLMEQAPHSLTSGSTLTEINGYIPLLLIFTNQTFWIMLWTESVQA